MKRTCLRTRITLLAFGLSALCLLLLYPVTGSGPQAWAQEGTPYPTEYCMFDSEGNWVCFSGTNDLTGTPTPTNTAAQVPTLVTFVPTNTPVPMLTPTPTIAIQPGDICVLFYCVRLPIIAR